MSEPHPDPSGDAPGFRRAFIAVVVTLGVLVATLGVVTGLQGPKLASVQVDPSAVVAKSGQQLRVFANQNVRAIRRAQVAVSPVVPFTVSSSGQVIAVQFTRPLDYSTKYTVTIDSVTSAADGVSSTLTTSFATGSPRLYFLRRGVGGVDEVIETGIRDSELRVAYSARRIQSFAAFPKALAVATLDAHGDSVLTFVASGGREQRFDLPGAGTIDQLHANADSGILGFRFTSAGNPLKRRYTDALFTVNPNGTAIATPVKGVAAQPISVLDWRFVPASSDIVAQADDLSLQLIDTSKADAVTPLGSFPQFGDVSADGATLTVADVDGWRRLDLAKGTSRPLTPASSTLTKPVDGAAIPYAGGWLQVESTYDAATGGFVDHLMANTATTSREIFHTPDARGRVDAVSISPNGQFVAIEFVPNVKTAKPDGYAIDGRATSVTVDFVDLGTGALVTGVAGFGLQWGN